MNSASLEARLAALAAAGETTSYGQLARELGLRMAALTAQLEALMQEDAAARHPFRAALVNARGRTLPALGFFAKAEALGQDITDPVAFVARHRELLFAGG